MDQLNAKTLTKVASNIKRPTYDRSRLKPGLVHIGVGAFHRCHQAEFTEDLLERGIEDRFVTGINLRPPVLNDTLGQQAGLYSRTLVTGDTQSTRVIGALRKFLDLGEDPTDVIYLLADPATKVVTLTVTEKGYCHIPSTGHLNPDNPDIIADLHNPERPRSLPGILVAALALRMQRSAGAITLISCDNVQSNGAVLQACVTEFAELAKADCRDWIVENVHFPSTMVDRIVPAIQENDILQVARNLGVHDSAAVIGEPFRQWVIENNFGPGMPKWELVGAEIVEDVEPYEIIKMRVLNGAQSTLSHLGCLLKIETSCLAAADPTLRQFTRDMLELETASTLPDLPSMPVAEYINTTFERLDNSAIFHTCHQIATDGSQKIIQRLLNPLTERAKYGSRSPMLTTAVASWAAYLACASDNYGARWSPSDPLAEEVKALADLHNDPKKLSLEIIKIRAVFSAEISTNPQFKQDFTNAFCALIGENPEAFLRERSD